MPAKRPCGGAGRAGAFFSVAAPPAMPAKNDGGPGRAAAGAGPGGAAAAGVGRSFVAWPWIPLRNAGAGRLGGAAATGGAGSAGDGGACASKNSSSTLGSRAGGARRPRRQRRAPPPLLAALRPAAAPAAPPRPARTPVAAPPQPELELAAVRELEPARRVLVGLEHVEGHGQHTPRRCAAQQSSPLVERRDHERGAGRRSKGELRRDARRRVHERTGHAGVRRHGLRGVLRLEPRQRDGRLELDAHRRILLRVARGADGPAREHGDLEHVCLGAAPRRRALRSLVEDPGRRLGEDAEGPRVRVLGALPAPEAQHVLGAVLEAAAVGRALPT